ncbi:MAG: hypothetical protein L0Z70_09880 [Chloroflexi bacterium]|nr:hypothetical protein [Chloroflexota bacterium]
MSAAKPVCLYCNRTSHEIPLLSIQYRGEEHFICPQHLPILIHKPAQLADLLPGVENLPPVEPH